MKRDSNIGSTRIGESGLRTETVTGSDPPDAEDPAHGAAAPATLGQTFLRNRMGVAGLAALIGVALFSFLGPHLYQTNQINTNIVQAHLAPSWQHPLGTDQVGYDILGRLMVAGQSSLIVGFSAAILASFLGTLWGAIAGYCGGWIDAVMMRVVDSFLSVPPLLLALVLASVYKPTIPVLIVVLAVLSWLVTARVVRGEALSLRVRDFVRAARFVGSRERYIIRRHILPNIIGSIAVLVTLSAADAILLLAALSYLGLGPPPPAANWGEMLANGLNYAFDGYWWLVYPAGILIVLTVVAINLIGDALREAFDVRLQQR